MIIFVIYICVCHAYIYVCKNEFNQCFVVYLVIHEQISINNSHFILNKNVVLNMYKLMKL